MVKITYVEHSGIETVVDAKPGQSLMKAAVNHGVEGIVADCGGNCACCTCRVFIDNSWLEKLPAAKDDERDMLEFSGDPHPGARLSCQITVSEDFDGMVVHLPASQY